jgi:hypothetical protein
LFSTKRGIIALLAFATVWFIILHYFVSAAATIVTSSTFKQMANELFGALGLSALLKWPVPEFAIYWLVAVYSFPIFSLFAASDQICSDKSRGTLRFISLRATRLELILGRFLGQVMILALLILMTLLATTLLAMSRDSGLALASIGIAAKLFFELLVVILPFVALMTALNCLLSSARMALVSSVLFFGLGPLFVTFIKYQFGQSFYLEQIFPGGQITDILAQAETGIQHFGLPIAQTLVLLFISHLLIKRESL